MCFCFLSLSLSLSSLLCLIISFDLFLLICMTRRTVGLFWVGHNDEKLNLKKEGGGVCVCVSGWSGGVSGGEKERTHALPHQKTQFFSVTEFY